MQRYNPKDIEPKWQKAWADEQQYKAVDFDERPKYVMLTEFPYPSGAGIHIGHAREYTLGDIMARQKRMQGYNVLYPMGYDAFGLPTENYAIKNKISPQEATEVNVANFQKQLESLGLSIDWARSFRTSDPDYYKWTQWLFLQFFKQGLAYQDEIAINWCPFCKTGLANEEVINGRHERCDTPVEKKSLKQWMLKITAYADRLIDGLQTVDYPSRIADQQINWIGRSKGAEVRFPIEQQGEKPNFVILHGYTGRADKNFIPWLKETLESQGFTVQAPQMPNTDHPVESEQVGYVLENCTFDRNTVLVGHSLGGVVAMKVLQKLDRPIKKLVLVAPAVEPTFRAVDYERPFVDTFDFTYDYQDIMDKAPERVVLSENQEADTRKPYLEYLSEKIDAPLLEATGVREHFRGDTEPFIADIVMPKVTVFTTRPDTLFGATFLVLAPEHELVQQIVTAEHKAQVETYIKAAAAKSDIERQTTGREKTGVFTGAYAVNPMNGEKIPVWIADYVLTGYGTGAIMAVPAHDERDYAFAEKFDLPAVRVIQNDTPDDTCTSAEGVMMNSGEYDGMASSEARDKIVADLVAKGVATEKINYRLRDWIFSRQHYWGEPIPIIHCPDHGAVAVPDDQLPVELPTVDHYEPTDTGESPLSEIADWVNTTCPTCGKPATRETDTMPNWAGSSWYYLRYFDAHNDQAFVDRKKLDYWQDVDLYLGGMEHTTLHLLYSRFWHEFFYDQGLVPTPEPYKARRGQGIILAADGTKMSKSKGNVVSPTDVIEAGYGADALRLCIAFLAPYDQTTPWSPEGVAGTHRFLQRVWALVQEFQASAGDPEADAAQAKAIYRTVHKTIKKVSRDLQDMGFNTAIAALMECVNELYKLKAGNGFADREAWQFTCETLALLLAPFAPHIAEELWQQLGHDSSIHQSSWPVFDEQYLVEDTVRVAVQVNGKVRGQLQVAQDADQETVLKVAHADAKIAAYLTSKEVAKVIYVPGKILSLVAK